MYKEGFFSSVAARLSGSFSISLVRPSVPLLSDQCCFLPFKMITWGALLSRHIISLFQGGLNESFCTGQTQTKHLITIQRLNWMWGPSTRLLRMTLANPAKKFVHSTYSKCFKRYCTWYLQFLWEFTTVCDFWEITKQIKLKMNGMKQSRGLICQLANNLFS